jgi:hypothetical protein
MWNRLIDDIKIYSTGFDQPLRLRTARSRRMIPVGFIRALSARLNVPEDYVFDKMLFLLYAEAPDSTLAIRDRPMT